MGWHFHNGALAVIAETKMSARAKYVLVCLAIHAHDESRHWQYGLAWPGDPRLAREAHSSTKTVTRAKAELIALKLIDEYEYEYEYEYEHGGGYGGQGRSSTYRMLFEPLEGLPPVFGFRRRQLKTRVSSVGESDSTPLDEWPLDTEDTLDGTQDNPGALDLAAHQANARVAESLYKLAVGGNLGAVTFWLKTRARWRETDRLEVTDPERKPLGSDAVAQLVARIDLIAERKAALAEGGIIEGSAVVEGEGGSDSEARG
jgi:hypothetical protein